MSSISVAQASARGTLILFLGNLVSTGLATVSVILVARLLGPEGYGLYTLAFLVPGIIQLFVGFGVASAVTRYVAFCLSTGELAKATSMTRTAIAFTLVFGVALSALNYFIAPLVLISLLHRQVLVQYQAVSSLLVLGTAASTCATSALVGWGSMVQVGAFTVLQSAAKLVLQVGLILAGFGVLGAVVGHIASYLIEAGAAIAALYLVRFKGSSLKTWHFAEDLRTMVRYGLPIFTGSIAQGVSSQYSTLILAAFASNAVIGYYQAALNVTVPISVIAVAVANVLFRSFAQLHGLEEDISLAFAYAVRYVSLISTPVVFFLLAAAPQLFDLFYGPAYAPGVFLLRLVAISFLPVAVGLTVIPSFLSGIGRSGFTMFVWITYSVSLVIAATILVAGAGLAGEGIMLALFAANSAEVVLGLGLSLKYLGVRISGGPLIGIFLAGAVACLAISILPVSAFSSLEVLLLDCVVYTVAYLTLVPLLTGLGNDDIIRLSISVDTMGPLRGFFRALLRYEQKVLDFTGRGGAS